MSSDVFIISSARGPAAQPAISQALQLAGLRAAQVQDVLFGFDGPFEPEAPASAAQAAGLTGPLAVVSPGLRALLFAAASLLSDGAELALVVGLDGQAAAAALLASAEAVGRLNLFPCARLAGRSLRGPGAALRQAGLQPADLEVSRESPRGALLLLDDLLKDLESRRARWGMLRAGELALVIERL